MSNTKKQKNIMWLMMVMAFVIFFVGLVSLGAIALLNHNISPSLKTEIKAQQSEIDTLNTRYEQIAKFLPKAKKVKGDIKNPSTEQVAK